MTGRKFQEGIHTFLRSTYVTVHRASRQYSTVMLYKRMSSLNLTTLKKFNYAVIRCMKKGNEERNTDLSNYHNSYRIPLAANLQGCKAANTLYTWCKRVAPNEIHTSNLFKNNYIIIFKKLRSAM